jgi:hypothetical protein
VVDGSQLRTERPDFPVLPDIVEIGRRRLRHIAIIRT